VSFHDAVQQLIIILIGVLPLRVLNDYGGDTGDERRGSR
jgi:hypothetical protein